MAQHDRGSRSYYYQAGALVFLEHSSNLSSSTLLGL